MDIVNGFIHIVNGIYEFLWGDLIAIPLPGGGTVGISLLVLLLIPAGIFFTVRLRFPQIRLFSDMIRAVTEKNDHSVKGVDHCNTWIGYRFCGGNAGTVI